MEALSAILRLLVVALAMCNNYAPAVRQAIENAVALFEPAPVPASLPWFCSSVRTYEGQPYNHGEYPHIGAPGGPSDALDDPIVRTIGLQWGARLGKTFFGQAAQQFFAETCPAPMMLASVDEKTAKEVADRSYQMLEHSPVFRRSLLLKSRRNSERIDFPRCRVHLAWALSVATLSDKAIRFGHANELDKWGHAKKAKEADPFKLFMSRGKEFTSRKFIIESTPQIKGQSRIEGYLQQSTNCRYFVPCPHCKHYQQLRLGDGKSPGGIVWDHLDGGKSNKDLAQRTARYVCEACHQDILSRDRHWMMRRGVWIPEGCEVNHAEALRVAESHFEQFYGAKGGDGASATDGYQWAGWSKASWIIGTPARDGFDAGYQLSSLYALKCSWGDVAAEFVASKHSPQLFRDFVNGWLGETWEIVRHKTTWEQLGERLASDVPPAVVPLWASLVTVGVDRQVDHFAYVADAWGPDWTSHTLEYGESPSLQDLFQRVLTREYPHADQGPPLKSCFALIDSGYLPEGVVAFCNECVRKHVQVWPSKGASSPLDTEWVARKSAQDSATPGQVIVWLDAYSTQGWIERQLHELKCGEPGAHTVYRGPLALHQDYLQQLLNDAPVEDLDVRNNHRITWKRINPNIPNDYRDCRRNSRVAMLAATRGQPIMPRGYVPPVREPARPKLTMPDGSPYFILER